MARTLLVTHHRASWRDWLKDNGEERDWLILDPENADYGVPTRAVLIREGKVAAFRLLGSVDAKRTPMEILAAAGILLPQLSENGIIVTFAVRLAPVLRHMALLLSEMVRPDEILVPARSRMEHEPWPIGASVVELPEPFPPMVREAQRRARWIELLAACEHHTIALDEVGLQGTRLGSGRILAHRDFPDYAEVSGGVLHIVSDEPPEDKEVARAMDVAHATRMSVVRPDAYEGLICSFANQAGEDFGMGRIKSFDPDRRIIEVQSDAIAPAPVRILRIGSLRIDLEGREHGDVAPWTV